MIEKLVLIGLLVLPFFVWPGMDTREPKYLLAAALSLLVALWGLRAGIRPYRNPWALAFVAFAFLGFLLSPSIGIVVSGVPMASWVLQAFFYLLVFFLAHVVIAGAAIGIPRVLDTMILAGVVMSVYAFLQHLKMDQFFNPTYLIAGTLGNPDLLAPFLAMIVPIALYRRKTLVAVGLGTMVFFINSQVAYGAMVVSLLFLFGTRSVPARIVAVTVGALLASFLAFGPGRAFVHDGGRFAVNAQVVRDLQNPIVLEGVASRKYSLTGFGLGSFRYLFHVQHPIAEMGDTFVEAHNDYAEILYNTGVLGLGLFLVALLTFVRSCYPLDRLQAHLLASFVCIAVCAGGIFAWQNGAIIFYTLVITGMLVGRSQQT
jgi:hypothetical protein